MLFYKLHEKRHMRSSRAAVIKCLGEGWTWSAARRLSQVTGDFSSVGRPEADFGPTQRQSAWKRPAEQRGGVCIMGAGDFHKAVDTEVELFSFFSGVRCSGMHFFLSCWLPELSLAQAFCLHHVSRTSSSFDVYEAKLWVVSLNFSMT